MRLTEYLKSLINKERQIQSDGKNYNFKPGKEGSLIAPGKPEQPLMETAEEIKPKAKVIGPTIIGSSRG